MKDIKELYKNPLFYYVLVLALAALWPLILWSIYLPTVRRGISEDISQYEKAMQIFEEIRNLDPDRLNASKEENAKVDFDYATAVQQTAGFASIPASNYKLSSGTIVTSQGRKSQSANISLKDVDVTKAMRFLSTIQLRWSSLQCTQVTLKKKKGLPDSWDVDFTFKYFY
jgi:hypothetical protein